MYYFLKIRLCDLRLMPALHSIYLQSIFQTVTFQKCYQPFPIKQVHQRRMHMCTHTQTCISLILFLFPVYVSVCLTVHIVYLHNVRFSITFTPMTVMLLFFLSSE